MNEQIYDLIFQGDDIKWQTIIHELVREGKVDPWDVDLSVLSREYIGIIKKLKAHNFRLSGKVILAAAILLKMKTDRLGVEQLLQLTNPEDYPEELELQENAELQEKHFTKAKLNLRIPGIRKRKVTMFELVDALKKALEVDEKRRFRQSELAAMMKPHRVEIRKVDVFSKIDSLWKKIKEKIKRYSKNLLQFSELTPTKDKKEIIWTLIPLLHLAQQNKIELKQDGAFGEIFIEVQAGAENEDLNKAEFDLEDIQKPKLDGKEVKAKKAEGDSEEDD